jgi:hypothetical protein
MMAYLPSPNKGARMHWLARNGAVHVRHAAAGEIGEGLQPAVVPPRVVRRSLSFDVTHARGSDVKIGDDGAIQDVPPTVEDEEEMTRSQSESALQVRTQNTEQLGEDIFTPRLHHVDMDHDGVHGGDQAASRASKSNSVREGKEKERGRKPDGQRQRHGKDSEQQACTDHSQIREE